MDTLSRHCTEMNMNVESKSYEAVYRETCTETKAHLYREFCSSLYTRVFFLTVCLHRAYLYRDLHR